MTNWNGHGGSWGGDAPVYSTDFDQTMEGQACPYPDVWITTQRWKPSERRTGRDCIGRYTPTEDPSGWQALKFGGAYYNEGMSCDPESEHEKRVLCFEAAELLYLHAAHNGNPYGHLNLGYVYSYDRCEGRYWGKGTTWETEENPRAPYPHLEKAIEHYRAAASAGIAEACYKLGDHLRDGRGCEADPSEAFRWFCKAYELGRDQEPVVWGSAALRLGHACEEGEGCQQSFEEAMEWYERAATGLGIAVRGDEQWYRGALHRANAGLARVRQELDGRY